MKTVRLLFFGEYLTSLSSNEIERIGQKDILKILEEKSNQHRRLEEEILNSEIKKNKAERSDEIVIETLTTVADLGIDKVTEVT